MPGDCQGRSRPPSGLEAGVRPPHLGELTSVGLCVWVCVLDPTRRSGKRQTWTPFPALSLSWDMELRAQNLPDMLASR
jgi:hypothetical protein